MTESKTGRNKLVAKSMVSFPQKYENLLYNLAFSSLRKISLSTENVRTQGMSDSIKTERAKK